MLDQDTALALLAVADEHGATLALVGDRAQLAAVGRGGVLDIAAQLTSRVLDMTGVHRFTDPAHADLTVRMRRSENPALLLTICTPWDSSCCTPALTRRTRARLRAEPVVGRNPAPCWRADP